jgi:outer membrane assembly lipoprotein YfiO
MLVANPKTGSAPRNARSVAKGPVLAAGRAAAAVALALAGLAAGCGTTNPYPDGSWARASYFADHGKHREAVDAFDRFLRRSPGDSLADEAQLRKARQLLDLKEYPLAAVELQILRQEYPASEHVPESWFLEGVALVKQVGRVEHDITPALDARSRFQKFLSLDPDSTQAAEARAYLDRIDDILLRKKLGEAEVFRQLGHPEAAGVVLGTALSDTEDGKLRPQVLLRRAQVALKAGDRDAAVSAWEELVASYPRSSEARAARAELRKMGRTPGGEP